VKKKKESKSVSQIAIDGDQGKRKRANLVRDGRGASFPCTIPSIALCIPSTPSALSSSPTSGSSEMSGTVGRESRAEMGACVKGVFCGVGAVRWALNIEVLMVPLVVKGEFLGRR
jgi:hypothetical protein